MPVACLQVHLETGSGLMGKSVEVQTNEGAVAGNRHRHWGSRTGPPSKRDGANEGIPRSVSLLPTPRHHALPGRQQIALPAKATGARYAVEGRFARDLAPEHARSISGVPSACKPGVC